VSNITRELARFAVETRWQDLPQSMAHETKLILLDSIGCALGALTTDKGKMSVALARRLGGTPESSVIGLGGKVSCATAALANGELMLALDVSPIIAGGHDGVYVIPSVLAMAQSAGASGRDLILATALGLEVSARLARATGRRGGGGFTGNAYSNFGAAAGAGRLLGLDEERLLHALGVAGHLCMVLTYARWGYGGRYMAKYGVPGWQGTGALTAVLLAEMGYTGDTTVLDDPEHGFAYYVGYKSWDPDEVTHELGKTWSFTGGMHYKPYPCCGVFHGALDCLAGIIEQHELAPEEIESVTAYCGPSVEAPPFTWNEIDSIAGAQFNPRYAVALLVHGVKRGVEWYDPDTMTDPAILEFMDRVVVTAYPDDMKAVGGDLAPPFSGVDVAARGRTFEGRTAGRGAAGRSRMTDEEIVEKFRHNAARVLTREKTDRAVEALLELEGVADVSQLMREVTP